MSDIPDSLKCAYCERSYRHGGECKTDRSHTGCLFFKEDKYGCIRNKDASLDFDLFANIPPVGEWCEDFDSEVSGLKAKFKINRINGLQWVDSTDKLKVYCNIDYYSKAFDKNKKPVLKLIKKEGKNNE